MQDSACSRMFVTVGGDCRTPSVDTALPTSLQAATEVYFGRDSDKYTKRLQVTPLNTIVP